MGVWEKYGLRAAALAPRVRVRVRVRVWGLGFTPHDVCLEHVWTCLENVWKMYGNVRASSAHQL